MKQFLIFSAVSIAIFAEPASACRDRYHAVPMPNESWDAFEERSKNVAGDLYAIGDYEREKLNFTEAEFVFFGQVVSSMKSPEPNASGFYNNASIQPIFSIRGSLPEASLTLGNNLGPKCWVDGHGYAGSAEVGEYVIVFMGVDTHGTDGIDSILATDSRHQPILDAIANYLHRTGTGPIKVDEQTGIYSYRQEDGTFKEPD